jgi:hypothetical protein
MSNVTCVTDLMNKKPNQNNMKSKTCMQNYYSDHTQKQP